MDNYFSQRHTVRAFTEQDVPDTLIREILAQAAQAPNTGNMQLYSVIVTRNVTQKNALAPAHFSQPAFTGAPVILTFCADLNRFIKWCKANNADAGFDNLQSLVAAAIDTTILAQQFVTIAEKDYGLGTCYLGTTTYNPDVISRILELPALVVPVVTLSIGYPAAVGTASDRLTPEAYLHLEKYKDYTAADIEKYYGYKEDLPENKHFIQENNKENLAQVFAEIRYPRTNNELFSEKLSAFIAAQLGR